MGRPVSSGETPARRGVQCCCEGLRGWPCPKAHLLLFPERRPELSVRAGGVCPSGRVAEALRSPPLGASAPGSPTLSLPGEGRAPGGRGKAAGIGHPRTAESSLPLARVPGILGKWEECSCAARPVLRASSQPDPVVGVSLKGQ